MSNPNLPTGCLLKCLPILGGDEAVDDWIDSGVEVEENSSDVHELLISHKVRLFRDPVQAEMSSIQSARCTL